MGSSRRIRYIQLSPGNRLTVRIAFSFISTRSNSKKKLSKSRMAIVALLAAHLCAVFLFHGTTTVQAGSCSDFDKRYMRKTTPTFRYSPQGASCTNEVVQITASMSSLASGDLNSFDACYVHCVAYSFRNMANWARDTAFLLTRRFAKLPSLYHIVEQSCTNSCVGRNPGFWIGELYGLNFSAPCP